MRRSLPLFLAVCLLLVVLLPGSVLAADHPVTLDNPVGGTLTGSDTEYTLTLPEGTASASFDMQVRGMNYSAGPAFSVEVEGDDGIVRQIAPTGGRFTRDTLKVVELELRQSGALQANLFIRFQYIDAPLPPPESITVRVVRDGEAAGTPASGAEEPVSLSEDYTMISDPLNLPEVTVTGNEARLTYTPRQLVSLGNDTRSVSLTIHDVQQLLPDTALPLADLGIDIELPATHVNAVLSAKARQLAESYAGLLLVEPEVHWDGEEEPPEAASPEGMIRLQPSGRVLLDEGVELFYEGSPVDVEENGRFSLLVGTAPLLRAFAQNEDWALELELSYKGFYAEEPVEMLVSVYDMSRFPSLRDLQGEAALPVPEEDGDFNELGELDWSGLLAGGLVVPRQVYRDGQYIQFLDDSLSFASNVPLGMVTRDEVRLDIPQSFTVQATRDDEEYQFLRGVSISQPGSYRIELQAVSDANEEGLSALYLSEFYFRILDEEVGDLPLYTPPQGFRIASVSIDGRALDSPSDTYCWLRRDGSYRIDIAHRQDSTQAHTLEFRYKTSVPVLFLDGVVAGQSTREPVRFTASEPGAHVTVQRDGGQIRTHDNTVSEPGFYDIVVRDNAGNSTQYSFRILYSMNLSAWTSFVLLFLLASGIVGYGLYLRTHMKVR